MEQPLGGSNPVRMPDFARRFITEFGSWPRPHVSKPALPTWSLLTFYALNVIKRNQARRQPGAGRGAYADLERGLGAHQVPQRVLRTARVTAARRSPLPRRLHDRDSGGGLSLVWLVVIRRPRDGGGCRRRAAAAGACAASSARCSSRRGRRRRRSRPAAAAAATSTAPCSPLVLGYA